MELKNKLACLVGSRKITKQDKYRIAHIAELLDELGFTARSGGATGADSEWAKYIDTQVFLPHNGFNHLRQTADFSILALENAPKNMREKAEKIAREHHEYGDSLSGFALNAHTRNVFQALGVLMNHETIADVTVYVAPETPAGKVSGGTATAVEVSRSNGVPTFNLRKDGEYNELIRILEEALED